MSKRPGIIAGPFSFGVNIVAARLAVCCLEILRTRRAETHGVFDNKRRSCSAARVLHCQAIQRLTRRDSRAKRGHKKNGPPRRTVLNFHCLQGGRFYRLGVMKISTRRFCCRPAEEPLLATGLFSPWPNARKRLPDTPAFSSTDRTLRARRSESCWL